jgi:hypothetical protein
LYIFTKLIINDHLINKLKNFPGLLIPIVLPIN